MRSRDARRLNALLALVAALGSGSAALAHSLDLMQGELVVYPDCVVLTIEGDGRSLAHWRGAEEQSLQGDTLRDAGYEQMDAIAKGVQVRDAAGGRLRVVSAKLTLGDVPTQSDREQKVSYTLEYRGGEDRSVLVFHYVPAKRPRHYEKIALAVHGAGQDEQQMLQLTSEGNVQFLDVQVEAPASPQTPEHVAAPPADRVASPQAPARVRIRIATRFSHPSVELLAAESSVTARVRFPIYLVAAWIPLERQSPDVLSVAEQRTLLPRLRELFGRAMSIDHDDAAQWPPDVTLALLPPSATSKAQAGAPLSIWTGRVEATLRWSDVAAADAVATWHMFNGAVLTIDAQLGEARTPVELTTYAPHIAVRDALASSADPPSPEQAAAGQ